MNNTKLIELSVYLKQKFYGIDQQIDRIIKIITPWYEDPELVDKPIVIPLWGMTGTGKTQLVREIYNFLFPKKERLFLETDCRDLYYFIREIKGLEKSSFSNPSMFLLDEFQFAKSIENGKEVKVHNHDFLWSFLSDGSIMRSDLNEDKEKILNDSLRSIFKSDNLKLKMDNPVIKDLLGIGIDLQTIIGLVNSYEGYSLFKQLQKEVHSVNRSSHFFLKKALIFISGNLDSAFFSTYEVDSDALSADELCEKTKKITSVDIKENLFSLFRAEQVARLGNNHVVFYALSEKSYRLLINKKIEDLQKTIKQKTNSDMIWQKSFEDFIYQHGVVPSQGARNLLSFFDSTIRTLIPNLCYWIKTNKSDMVEITAQADRIVFSAISQDYKLIQYSEKIEGIILENQLHEDKRFQRLVALHEAGHAVVWYAMTKTAPELIKSKSSSSSAGGYVKLPSLRFYTRKDFKNRIATALGGYVAEKRFGGDDAISAGSSGDLTSATTFASRMVRELAMGGKHLSKSSMSSFDTHSTKSFSKEDDQLIEDILRECEAEVNLCLDRYDSLYQDLVEILTVKTKVTKEEFLKLANAIEQESVQSDNVQVWNLKNGEE